MGDLDAYQAKRDQDRTPEPVEGVGPGRRDGPPIFVVQEHHARALHWDFRLERDGVLVSWAVPKGLPADSETRRLAVHVEDHPLEYAAFEGDIPRGEYGGGNVAVWDTGTYDCEKWTDREVMVVLHGHRVEGRYVLIKTRDKTGTRDNQWLMRRLEADPEGSEPFPHLIQPMLAVAGDLPRRSEGWAFEFKWDGVRAVVYVDGGRVRVLSRTDRDVTGGYPELAGLGASLGSTRVVLDGEIVAMDEATGRPSFAALQSRMQVTDPARARKLAAKTPVTYLAFDVLYQDGRSTLGLPYRERRGLLEGLGLAGRGWAVPPSSEGDGPGVLAVAEANHLEGVVAKRVDSLYHPGRRSTDWVKVKVTKAQEVVVGGWSRGQGRRAGGIGALLLGVQGPRGLEYVGKVGTGFTEAALADLAERMGPLARPASPFVTPVPGADAAGVTWLEPSLVGEVGFGEWTTEGRLRHPTWRGLRFDKRPEEVVRE